MIHKAKKSLGQNFLKSEPALREIIKAGEINSDDIILEIGPGKGVLTKQLLASSCQVLAIEKDRELFELLKIKFRGEISSGQLRLIYGDILEFNTRTYNLETRTYKVIANIPYNITGAILKKFLTDEHQPERIILMVQKEVAERIVARDGKESLLSISVKAYGEPKLVMKVPKRYFSPAPKVDSAVISIKNISRKYFNSPLKEYPTLVGGGRRIIPLRLLSTKATPQEGNLETKFWEIVKLGFAHKRKKLSGNLKSLKYGGNASVLELLSKRAEDLTLKDWMLLAQI